MRSSSFLQHALSVSIVVALAAWTTEGFVPQSTTSKSSLSSLSHTHTHVLRATTSSDESTKEVEKSLRQELADRNLKVEDEGKYAVVDGTGMNTENTETAADAATTEEVPMMSKEAKMLERLIKKRAYPLFLAEKGVEIIEDTVEGLFGSKNNGAAPNKSGEREKVVVLGTGWGAAAFLKGIDASRYDVTVISPRNYFVFTPMLAGASVGTVDYRSITQPIREVRIELRSLVV
jgi:hypothetical protein